MLEERVSIYKTVGDSGNTKTTIVVDNMTEKTRQTILAALYSINVPLCNQDITGYISNSPTANEANAMEEAAADVSDMELYATTTEENAAFMADSFFNDNYCQNNEEYIKKIVETYIQADAENNVLVVKAMYIAADRILTGDYSDKPNELRTLLFYCSYMLLYKETFKIVAEQKGIVFNDEEYSICIIHILQCMTFEEMITVIAAVEKKY